MSEFSKGHCSLQTVCPPRFKARSSQRLLQAGTITVFSWFEGDCSSFVWSSQISLVWPWTLHVTPTSPQAALCSFIVYSATARFELWVSFPSCTARAAKFVISFSGMLKEHCLSLTVPVMFWFFLRTKMLSGITVLCLAKKGNTAGSECCFHMFIRDWYKSFLAGLTAPVILCDCCHTSCFSPE